LNNYSLSRVRGGTWSDDPAATIV